MSNFVQLEMNGGVAEIVLAHEAKRNALSPEMLNQLDAALDQVSADDAIKVILLRSSASVFCAGADLEHLQEIRNYDYEQNLEDSHAMRRVFDKLMFLPKIVISLVEGPALAGGCGLANLADLVWASDKATFGFTEVKIGFVPALVSIYLRKRIRGSVIREMALTGRILSATEAQEFGMVNRVVTPDNALDELRAYAQQLVASVSLQSVIMTKSLLLDTHSMPRGEALDYAEDVNARSRMSDDWNKGVTAFFNKEKPKWD